MVKWFNTGVCKTPIHRFESGRRLHLPLPAASVTGCVVKRSTQFQINGNDSKAGGGSCFGDSGGGVFLGDFVLGDASYVNSLTCNALGSSQRVDTAYSRAFVDSFLD